VKNIFFLFLFLCSVAHANTGAACFSGVVGEQLSAATSAWLRGEISAEDPELQAQKKIRMHSKEVWTETTFAKIFPKLGQIMLSLGKTHIHQVWNYFGRPQRLARLVFEVGSHSKLLNEEQLRQLKSLADNGVPLKVEDWGAYESLQNHLFGIAATLAEPVYYEQAMTSAYLHQNFILKSLLKTYKETGSLATWTSTGVSNPIFVVFSTRTFHPILLSHPGLRASVENLLSTKNGSGQVIASAITQYVFDNFQTVENKPEVMNVFSRVLGHYWQTRVKSKGFQFDSYTTALDLAQRLGMQSSR
jgi:hypothetical protein